MFYIAQGEGRNVTTGNIGGHQYSTRIELLPFGEFANKGDYKGSNLKLKPTPKLALGFAHDFNNNAAKIRSNQDAYMLNDTDFYTTNIAAFFMDAMLKHKGFSLRVEVTNKTAADALARNSDSTLTGGEVQVGAGLNLQSDYLVSKTIVTSLSYTNIALDKNITGKGSENQYTIGFSKYISGHQLKVQTAVNCTDVGFKTNKLLYRLQVDIHF
jgi:phosphate-selective porin OprO/OprP